MSSADLVRRLEQLEAQLAPPSDEQVLKVTDTRVDAAGETVEIHLPEPAGRRRRQGYRTGTEKQR